MNISLLYRYLHRRSYVFLQVNKNKKQINSKQERVRLKTLIMTCSTCQQGRSEPHVRTGFVSKATVPSFEKDITLTASRFYPY